MDEQNVARKNGWPVLISAASAVTCMGCQMECQGEGGRAGFPANLAETARGGEERS
jgi:hypothetical protein